LPAIIAILKLKKSAYQKNRVFYRGHAIAVSTKPKIPGAISAMFKILKFLCRPIHPTSRSINQEEWSFVKLPQLDKGHPSYSGFFSCALLSIIIVTE